MYLIDTNVFLEILLDQAKKETCKAFLSQHAEHVHLSDFSLHSIGVVLFRHKRDDVFKEFARDVLANVEIVTLSKAAYETLPDEAVRTRLDFDDVYQFLVAKQRQLVIITMDRDFQNVQDEHLVTFL